jgi:hypothetical protein
MRLLASPGAGVTLYRMNVEIDIRQIPPTIRVPTLILHRVDDRLINPQEPVLFVDIVGRLTPLSMSV